MRVLFLDIAGVLAPAGAPIDNVSELPWLSELKSALEGHSDVALVALGDPGPVRALRTALKGAENRLMDVLAPEHQPAMAVQEWLRNTPDVLAHRIITSEPKAFGNAFQLELLACDSSKGISGASAREELRRWLERTAYLVEPVRIVRAAWLR